MLVVGRKSLKELLNLFRNPAGYAPENLFPSASL